MERGGSSGYSESHFLKIGQKIYFEDVNGGDDGKQEDGLSPVGGGRQKKGRTSGGGVVVSGGQQPPRCQVEGCNLDLSDAKTYYSRHKVCGVHSKTPKVIVNGLEQRFCQQCSRFHLLPEFDQGKRSCRRRLAGHNERRRKPTSGTLLSARYGSLPSSIFGNNASSGGFLMDFSSCSRGRVHWPNTTTADKFPPLPWQGNMDNPPPFINPSVPPGTGFNGVQDSNCALSLLSNHSASRNQTASHDYYVNTDAGAHLDQPPTQTMVQVHGQGHFPTSTSGWGYDTSAAAHLGLGQITQPGYPGELGLGQQGGRRYDSSADHIDEEFCLVTGLKFEVKYWADYNDEDEPIPFRRWVFPSSLDGKNITGKNVEELIKSKLFSKLGDDDAVSLCCIGILQLVLLGVEDRRAGHVHAKRLISDEIEAVSGWWVSSRAYFDGRVSEAERRPHHLNHQNHYEVPSEFYRDFQEQRSGLDQMMKQGQNIFEKMNKFMEDMSVSTEANKEPIIVDQHYGISDMSGFQSIQRPRREQRPSVYMHSPYTPLPPTTELPKKRVGKTKKKCKNDNLPPLNLANAFAYDNAGGDEVVITGVLDTGIYFTLPEKNLMTSQQSILNPYDVYLNCYMMGYLVPNFFWRQLVPHLCMPRSHSIDNPYQEGWLSGDQMNAWIEILIRSRPQNVDWTVSKSGTTCVHLENNRFMIVTDPHIIGTLDGSTRPYPPWKYVNWVYMPINVGGNH
nr:hypothetical protein [Tanacetum cinerariifolium]